MSKSQKRSNKRRSNDHIQDLFGHNPEQTNKVEQQPFFEGTQKVVIRMPNRGFTYSEEHRLACELRQLEAWYRSMTHTEWNELWEDIHRLRGEKATDRLSNQFEAYLYRDERDEDGQD